MNTEQMTEMLDMLNINELSLLANLATERKKAMENALVENAKAKFIKAYQDFRKLAPNATGWLYWEFENNCCGELEEQNFNLYEMLDCAIEHGVL
jgi:hypothetical protein